MRLPQVSWFEGVHTEFIIPEQLYLWRLETLEAAIGDQTDHDMNGLRVVTYFDPETPDVDEDPDTIPYRARLRRQIVQPRHGRDIHIRGSGYESLEIEWETGGENVVSPWDLIVQDRAYQGPPQPCMEENEKKKVLELLKNVARREDAREWFMEPVDAIRYSGECLNQATHMLSR